jgi:hypothetical protein
MAERNESSLSEAPAAQRRTLTRSAKQWSELARTAIRGLTQEQADIIGKMSFDAEAAGQNPAIWHQSALLFGHKCNCVPCRAALGAVNG